MQSIMSSYSRVCLVPTGYKHEFSVTLKKINCFFRELGCWNSFRDFLSAFFFLGKTSSSGNTYSVIYEGPLSDFPQHKRADSRRSLENSNHYRTIDPPKLSLSLFFFQEGMFECDHDMRKYVKYTKGLTHLLLCRSKEMLHLKVLHALPHILLTPAHLEWLSTTDPLYCKNALKIQCLASITPPRFGVQHHRPP